MHGTNAVGFCVTEDTVVGVETPLRLSEIFLPFGKNKVCAAHQRVDPPATEKYEVETPTRTQAPAWEVKNKLRSFVKLLSFRVLHPEAFDVTSTA